MKRLALFAALAAVSVAAQAAPVTYTIDNSHTYPHFTYNHLGFSNQTHKFDKTSGTVVLDREGGAGSVVVIIDATSRWALIRDGMMPFAVAVNSTPIIALAPIMNNWFGITNPMAKMSIVGVIVFFPVMINMVRGLTQVSAGALELMRSYAASEFAILSQLRIPNALPFVFSALKVASTLSVIGAVVSEYFGGTREALGVYISQQAALFHFAEAWAAIIVACAMGITFYALILLVERLLMPWHVSLRATEG